jgi:hypothetical protein
VKDHQNFSSTTRRRQGLRHILSVIILTRLTSTNKHLVFDRTLKARNSSVPPPCRKVIMHRGVASFLERENTNSVSGSICNVAMVQVLFALFKLMMKTTQGEGAMD